MSVVLSDRGDAMGALATDRIPSTVADCDRALALLRTLVRSGSLEERALARIAADDVLDRRLELTRPLRSRAKGA